MVMIETFDKSEFKPDKKEVLRYLGYGKNDADEKTLERIESLWKELEKELSPKVCYEIYPILREEDSMSFGAVKTDSQDLKKNLDRCSKAVVFVATIGASIDRIIGKYSNVSPLDAVISQAIGATLIEEVCDKFCTKLGENIRPRFSPGYGDFSIEIQKDILGMLDAPRKIGVTLTESLQMVPTKSVSAIVGIEKVGDR